MFTQQNEHSSYQQYRYPPLRQAQGRLLQKAQGWGTHLSGMATQRSKVWATRQVTPVISSFLSEDLHDGKNNPNASEHFANPKQTPISGTSQVRGSVVIVDS